MVGPYNLAIKAPPIIGEPDSRHYDWSQLGHEGNVAFQREVLGEERFELLSRLAFRLLCQLPGLYYTAQGELGTDAVQDLRSHLLGTATELIQLELSGREVDDAALAALSCFYGFSAWRVAMIADQCGDEWWGMGARSRKRYKNLAAKEAQRLIVPSLRPILGYLPAWGAWLRLTLFRYLAKKEGWRKALAALAPK